MVGHERILDELSRLVRRSPAEATSVCAIANTSRVVRFAYEAVHQDLVQESLKVFIKVLNRQRIGVAVADTLQRTSLARCLAAALEIARHTPASRRLPALPGAHHLIARHDHVAATAEISAAWIAGTLRRLFQICRGAGAHLAGSFACGEEELAVVNSQGVLCYHAGTVAGLKLVTLHGTLSGFASGVSRRLDGLDAEALLERALRQCLHRQQPTALAPGTYEVILEPEAVAELVSWLGYIGFGAKSLQERTSFMAGRIGERITGSSITIADDGANPEGLAVPFDFEGVPKRKVVLIDRGRASNIVYDTTYGLLYGHPSTGHGPPPDEIEGPLPSHLFMAPGRTRRADLIRACQRGVVIPRFHYVNGLLKPREALMTGLTREGAFLIEGGKPTRPVATMRFTQRILEAFEHVRGISRERQLIADPTQELGSCVMPAVHLAKFRFTGRSEE